MLITPPHIHMHLELLFSAGILPIRTFGQPGSQGAIVAGMQGIGVKTPSAAAVAAATVGLAKLVHIPKGKMFTKGLLSMMFAAGMGASTRLTGNTIRADGATPKEHLSVAPIVTCKPTIQSFCLVQLSKVH